VVSESIILIGRLRAYFFVLEKVRRCLFGLLQNFALGRKLLLSFRVELQPKGGLGFHGLSRLSQVSNNHIAPLFLQQLLVFQQHDNELASLLDQLQFVFELFGIHRMG
jgi:hypothetical protein